MPYNLPRCEVIPLPDQQASFRVDGDERLRWHFGANYPRPFFFPLVGPSGSALTRMGHPGAPNHDHHQSIWFAHHKVVGVDFWGNTSPARIRQQEWLAYEDGDEQAAMAVRLGWYDGHDPRELLQQELITILRPGEEGETLVELHAVFRPISETLEFAQTNFGFLAVRVAKSLAAHFGGGQLTNSEGARGEPAIFGQVARWMDYSGPVPVTRDGRRQATVEGITYFDHPSNPHQPTRWHVREDGWMGASVCMNESIVTTKERPLTLRYLLHAHAGPVDQARADGIARQFADSPGYSVVKSSKKHQFFEIQRD